VRHARALALAALALVACDKDRPEPPDRRNVPPATVASIASALRVDAGAIESPVDPPAPAGDIKAEIDRFTTVDACVAERAKLDPLLGDALDAIGYDTFLRDACKMLDAAKAKDSKRCDAIDASSLRARCATYAAEVLGDPDACPWDLPTRPELGRDAVCVAVAAHDPRLCAAAQGSKRAACDALVARDAERCKPIALASDRASCAREVERWRSLLPAPAEGLAAMTKPAATLRLAGFEGTPDPSPQETDVTLDVERGIAIVEQRDGVRFDLGTMRDVGGAAFVAPSPHTRPALAVSVFVPTAGKEGRVERAELDVPGRATLVTPVARGTLKVTIAKLERTRGGEVKLAVDGDVASSAASYHVHADVTTFVRDVVKAAQIYGAGLPRLDGGKLF
jgi:hypothetical protein